MSASPCNIHIQCHSTCNIENGSQELPEIRDIYPQAKERNHQAASKSHWNKVPPACVVRHAHVTDMQWDKRRAFAAPSGRSRLHALAQRSEVPVSKAFNLSAAFCASE